MGDKYFGKWLSGKRLEVGYETKKDLAVVAGLDPSTITKLENNENEPSLRTLKKLAPKLRVTLEQIMSAAGLNETVIDHGNYTEHIYTNQNGDLVDIVQRAKEMHKIDKDWSNTAYRVAKELSPTDRQAINDMANRLLEAYMMKKSNKE